jgi:hypothetical protein
VGAHPSIMPLFLGRKELMGNKKAKGKIEDRKGEEVEFTNGMIDSFNRNVSIRKLRNAPGLRAELKFRLYKLVQQINNSDEAKALEDTINSLIKEHDAAQAKIDADKRSPLQIDDPRVKEIHEINSGLIINKLCIPIDQLPGDFSADDMLSTDWIIDYVE